MRNDFVPKDRRKLYRMGQNKSFTDFMLVYVLANVYISNFFGVFAVGLKYWKPLQWTDAVVEVLVRMKNIKQSRDALFVFETFHSFA